MDYYRHFPLSTCRFVRTINTALHCTTGCCSCGYRREAAAAKDAKRAVRAGERDLDKELRNLERSDKSLVLEIKKTGKGGNQVRNTIYNFTNCTVTVNSITQLGWERCCCACFVVGRTPQTRTRHNY